MDELIVDGKARPKVGMHKWLQYPCIHGVAIGETVLQRLQP